MKSNMESGVKEGCGGDPFAKEMFLDSGKHTRTVRRRGTL